MASKKSSITLNDILQADRKKKKHEDIFNSIRERRSSAPGAAPTAKKGAAGASLASRMGVNKNLRASKRGGYSASLSRPNSALGIERGNRLHTQIHNSRSAGNLHSVANFRSPLAQSEEISIRGRAQPATYTVVASNFAPGTTAGDIESVMTPFGELLSCKLIASNPTVMAEMVFSEEQAAQAVIDYFNNKKADGRLLYVFLKNPVPNQKAHMRPSIPSSRVAQDDMDIDPDEIEVVGEKPVRRAEPTLQDGRYGFGENTYVANAGARRKNREPQFKGSGLRSDELIGRGRGLRRRG